MPPHDKDVIIIGAGLSGINAAYRLQERNPGVDYEILEGRDSLGGTWDLFRYPGVRSDSDFYTLCFPFDPWRGEKAIVTGDQILDYLQQSADRFGISPRISFGTRVSALSWSSDEGLWTVTAQRDGQTITRRARFVISATGYYDYESPYDPSIPGIEDFGGQVLHPQFWPQDLDYTGQRIVIVGSGATAITMVPAMAERAGHVTMLQRTPTYVLAQPWTDPVGDGLRKVLPPATAHRAIRRKNTALQWLLFQLSQRFPKAARRVLRRLAIIGTGSAEVVDEHFNPPYDPWDQRLCVSPGGDLFAAIKSGRASVATDRIAGFTERGITLASGEELPADIVVTATGLRLKIIGGIEVTVDGKVGDVAEHFVWNGTMINDVPNFGFVIGYINLSWTMRSDMTSQLLARVVERVLRAPGTIVAPRADDLVASGPLLQMESGYLARSAHEMPRTTGQYPWAMEQNYLRDSWHTNRSDIDADLAWSRVPTRVDA